MDDAGVWTDVCKPLQPGSMYMIEYASESAELRGIAINRYLQVLELLPGASEQ